MIYSVMSFWHDQEQEEEQQRQRDDEDQLYLERAWEDAREVQVCNDMGHPIRERLACRCGYRQTIIS